MEVVVGWLVGAVEVARGCCSSKVDVEGGGLDMTMVEMK